MRDLPCAHIEHCRSGNCETDRKLLFCVSTRPRGSSGGFDCDLNQQQRVRLNAAKGRRYNSHIEIDCAATRLNESQREGFAANSGVTCGPMVLKLRARVEFSSHTIRAAGRRHDLYRAHNCRPGWYSPVDSRSKFATRLRRALGRAHSCRPVPCIPAGSRSRFASYRRSRMVAAADNTEHLQFRWQRQLRRQSRRLPAQSLLSYPWKAPSSLRCLLAL
jgi:hypothetical protein